MEHRNITGLDAVHPFTIRQAADPGAIGADKGWLDDSIAPPKLKVRNATNTGWEIPSAGGEVKAFVDAAARNAGFPAPSGNELADLIAEGVRTRYDQAKGRWLAEGVTGTAGPVVRTGAKGGWGDGTHNELQAFVDADAATAAAGFHEVLPGTWRIDASVVLTGGLRPVRGAILQANAGAIVDIQGVFEAGDWPVFDESLGGRFIFTNNKRMSAIKAAWWGAKFDGTDDAPAVQRAVNAAPNYCLVTCPIGNYEMGFASQVVAHDREGVVLYTPSDSRWPSNTIPAIRYIGSAVKTVLIADFVPAASTAYDLTAPGGTLGADHQLKGAYMEVVAGKGAGQSRWILDNVGTNLRWGPNGSTDLDYDFLLDDLLDGTSHVVIYEPKPMIGLYNSRLCGVQGFYLFPNAIADIGVNIDSPLRGPNVGGGIGSTCFVRNCTMEAVPAKQHATCVAISLSQNPNQEYHTLLNNICAGGMWPQGTRTYTTGTSTAGSNSIQIPGGANANMVGQIIVLADAGPNTYRSFPLRARVTAVPDGTHLTLNKNATRAVTGGRLQIGFGSGFGLFVGAQANAKRIYSHENSYYGLGYAICSLNGSFHSDLDSFTDDACIIGRFNGSEPSSISKLNAEHCNKFLANASPEPLGFEYCRIDNGELVPSMPFCDSEAIESTITFDHCGFEQAGTDDASIFSGWGPGNTFHLYHVKFTTPTTWRHLWAPNFNTDWRAGQIQTDYHGLDRGFDDTAPRFFWSGFPGTESHHAAFAGDVSFVAGRTHLRGGVRKGVFEEAVAPPGTPITAVDCVYVSVHRINDTSGASPQAYPNPLNPVDGQELDIEWYNNSGGAFAVTMGTAFLGAYTAPANGKRNAMPWRYNGPLGKWVPRAAQSADV